MSNKPIAEACRTLTRRFKDVLDHYGLQSTRINPGQSHENGVAEKANDLLKTALVQAKVGEDNTFLANMTPSIVKYGNTQLDSLVGRFYADDGHILCLAYLNKIGLESTA